MGRNDGSASVMIIKSLGDGVIYLGMIATALVAIGVVLKYIVNRALKAHFDSKLQPIKDALSTLQGSVDGLDKRMSDHVTTHRNL